MGKQIMVLPTVFKKDELKETLEKGKQVAEDAVYDAKKLARDGVAKVGGLVQDAEDYKDDVVEPFVKRHGKNIVLVGVGVVLLLAIGGFLLNFKL